MRPPLLAADPASGLAVEARDPRAWPMVGLVALAELLGMSLWFTAAAVSPHFQAAWQLTPAQAGSLTTAVQLGFVAGTALAALLNLADLVPARWFFAASALLAAAANALLVQAPALEPALVLRFLTGFFLAGVYPPALKMAATWFRSGRGLAIGTVVAALTVGKAAPYLVEAVEGPDWRTVLATASGGAVVAAALVAAAYHDGPFAFPRRAFSFRLAGTVVRHRETRLATLGYLGHMWELYACWAALSLFFTDLFLRHGYASPQSGMFAAIAAFAGIAAGGGGCVVAGAWADRWGRENVAAAAMALSGACALTIGWLTGAPVGAVVALALVWGFAVVADSAQFSALVTEVAPPHAVGTALTLQTSLGFLLTALSIWLMLYVETRWGWGVAFSILAIGPALGITQMWSLKRVRNRTERQLGL